MAILETHIKITSKKDIFSQILNIERKNLDETLFSNDPNLTFETFKVALNSSVVESKMSVNFK